MSLELLSVEAVRQRMAHNANPFTIIDARDRAAFTACHIPGAIFMGWEEWVEAAPQDADPQLQQEGWWGVLDDPQALVERIALRGVSSDQPIVVYADGQGSMGRDGRIAWMLLYLGAQSVALLDGGWTQWLLEGGPTSTAPSTPSPVRFTLSVQEQRRVRFPAIRAAYFAGNMPLLVDTRSKDEFDGNEPDYYLPRKGHLSSAALFPFADLYDSNGLFVSREQYLESATTLAPATQPFVTYCEVGVRASSTALLHELYTGTVVPVFDGSLMQWSLDRDLPMESKLDLVE